MDDGKGGSYSILNGYYTNSMATSYTVTGIVKSRTYRFRYRAYNMYGWGPYSLTGYLLAAQLPGTPDAPTFVSATETGIVMSLNLAVDNGGATISSYVI